MRGHRGWRATPEKVSGNGSSEYSTAAEAGTGPARAHLGEGDWTRIWVESCITEIFCTSGLMTLTSVTTFFQPPCLSALQSRKGHLSEEVPNAFLVRRCGESILGSEASGWAHSFPLWQHLAQEPHRVASSSEMPLWGANRAWKLSMILICLADSWYKLASLVIPRTTWGRGSLGKPGLLATAV